MDTYGYKDRDGSNILELDRFLDLTDDSPSRFAVSRGVHPAGELLVPALWWLHLEKGCEFQPFLNYELGILDITIIVPN